MKAIVYTRYGPPNVLQLMEVAKPEPKEDQAMLLGSWLSRKKGKKMGFMGIAKTNQKDLAFMGKLHEGGKVVPFIDRCYPLDDVAAAIRYVAEGHARGKVVIQIS